MPKELLKRLTNKSHIYLLDSGDSAIAQAIKIANRKFTLIQDQGGWFLYKKLPNIIELKTDYGLLNLKELKEKANKNSLLIINSLSGYFAEQPMKEIAEICKEKYCFLINDVSGSIGTEIAKIGDIILGSFGKWKPINLEYGGFIASTKKLDIKENFNKEKLQQLKEKLEQLPKRLQNLKQLTNKVKSDLYNFNILHKDSDGINVIISYKTEEEKNKILKYCQENNLEYKLCPDYIKVNEKAVSIEIKRK